MATVAQHWRDRAITGSEKITDGWEVVKSYLARIAEPVLFVMMVANIIEMLPGVTVWPWFSAVVLGIQAVSLDVAGFGLNTMADHARRAGNEKAATKAERTGWLLIGIMIATLLAVATGMLFPQVIWILVYIEKALILIRVALTVWYGYVIHGLRSNHQPIVPPVIQTPPVDLQPLYDKIAQLETQLATMQATQTETIQETNESESDNEPGNEEGNSTSPIVDIEDYRNAMRSETDEPLFVDTEEHPAVNKKRNSVSTTVSTNNGRGEARQKALRMLKKYPQLTAPELAKKTGITRQYASKLIRETVSG